MDKVISHSVKETFDIAGKYAKSIQPGDVIGLKGNLGAGKTHFVKGFVEAFGISGEEVNSPTFTIINEYSGTVPVYHFDCYRLEDVEEALEIGAEEYFYGDGVCIVEWPDRISEILPPRMKQITINIIGQEEREFIFHNEV
ncbi:MAG: tRNA (adenosine(37)-N6)-threonylcarbamoyltransferase complex ATPase subunit type 1 TsaE [Balneolaceae bacterium]